MDSTVAKLFETYKRSGEYVDRAVVIDLDWLDGSIPDSIIDDLEKTMLYLLLEVEEETFQKAYELATAH